MSDMMAPPAQVGRRSELSVPDSLHTHLLVYFRELVCELGGDPSALLGEVGIVPTVENWSDPVASYHQVFELLERAATTLCCPDFGMRLAVRQEGTKVFGPLGAVMRHSPTLGEAIRYVSQHAYAHSTAARVWIRPEPEANGFFVGHDVLLDKSIGKGQAMEQILLIGHLIALQLTGGRSRARRVHLRRQPIVPQKVYRSYFNCEVLCNQKEDGVFYLDRDFAAPIVNTDGLLYQAAASYISTHLERDRPPMRVKVRGLVMQLLGSPLCTQDYVSNQLNLHKRALHRKLTAEGTSFQRIKNDVLIDFTRHLVVCTDLDFMEVAERLGFSEQSVLTRRCRQWFALTPTQLRQSRRPEGTARDAA